CLPAFSFWTYFFDCFPRNISHVFLFIIFVMRLCITLMKRIRVKNLRYMQPNLLHIKQIYLSLQKSKKINGKEFTDCRVTGESKINRRIPWQRFHGEIELRTYSRPGKNGRRNRHIK